MFFDFKVVKLYSLYFLLFLKNWNVVVFFFFLLIGVFGKGFEVGDMEEFFVEVRCIGGVGGFFLFDMLI